MDPNSTLAALFIQNAANILTAAAAFVAALGACISVFRNSVKMTAIDERTKDINDKTDVAAQGATLAASKAQELHETTQQIVAQTDGQITTLLEENKAMRDTFAKIVAILSARTGMVPAIRVSDVSSVLTIQDPPADTGERRRHEDLTRGDQ